jgi:hypothetical protein
MTMAGDWIKMRTDLYRDPRVCLIADELMQDDGDLARLVSQITQRNMSVTRNVMRNAVVGSLLSVWGVFRHRGKPVEDDLLVKGITLAVLDDVSDLPGLGAAMASVGWAKETDEGVVFPCFFEEYNVEPSESGKSKNAERQARYRARQKAKSDGKSDALRNVTSNVIVTPRIEKRREEQKKEKKKENREASPSLTLVGHSEKPEPKAKGQTLTGWLATLGPEEQAIPESDPVFTHAAKAGIPDDFIALAWFVFKSKYLDDPKRYRSWPQTFRNAVDMNWFKLWWFREGVCELTTAGIQAQRRQEAA